MFASRWDAVGVTGAIVLFGAYLLVQALVRVDALRFLEVLRVARSGRLEEPDFHHLFLDCDKRRDGAADTEMTSPGGEPEIDTHRLRWRSRIRRQNRFITQRRRVS